MCPPAAVRIDDDLAARYARVAMGTADHEFSGRVHVQDIIFADQFTEAVAGPFQTCFRARNQDRADIFSDFRAHGQFRLFLAAGAVGPDEFVVLRRNDDRVDPFGLFVVAVLDRHLAFRVGTQIGHLFAFAPDDGQFF